MFKKIAIALTTLVALTSVAAAGPLASFKVKDRANVLAAIVIHAEKCDTPHTSKIDLLESTLKLEGGISKPVALKAVTAHLTLIDTFGVSTWCDQVDTILDNTTAAMGG